MTRRNLLQLPALAMAAQQRAVPAASPRSPNLLFILADQQRRDTMAAYGNHQIIVPNLNRLAEQSVVFQHCYAGQPVCTPSRGTLQTGLYPHTHGSTRNNAPLASSVPSLVEMLPAGKYATGYFGKWHLGNEVCKQHGFQEFESTEDDYESYRNGSVCPGGPSGYSKFLKSHGVKPSDKGGYSRSLANKLPKELSKAGYLAECASSFIDRHHDRPWALYLSILDPHPPFNGPNDHLYDPAKMPVPANFSKNLDPTTFPLTRERRDWLDKRYPDQLGSADVLRKVEARYWGKVTLVDDMVGKVMAKLDRAGLADNTIVVFTADHGEMMGSHLLIQKSVLYEEAATVPCLLRIPWLKGRPPRVASPFSHIDVVPTLLELMQQGPPPHLQGRSWAATFVGGVDVVPRPAMFEWNPSNDPTEVDYKDRLRVIVTPDGWKMALGPDSQGELYNLNDDPHENHNLFYRKDALPTVRPLAHEIELWQRSTGDIVQPFDETVWNRRRAAFVANGSLQ